ncbi:MAG: hypothetical protein GY869_07220 [Planctomycetes bacterium]|nr:hypothetical protein [Planctomycetota bacterium]
MNRIVLVLMVFLFLSGCRDKGQVYELIVDDVAIELIAHEDVELVQDDLVAQVKPLWDELVEGESVIFYWKRVTTYRRDDLEKKLRVNLGLTLKSQRQQHLQGQG